MTQIYPTLISKIDTILSGVESVKEVFSYPTSKITKYPCAIFMPSGVENEVDTNGNNLKTYSFKVYVVIGVSQKSVSDAWATIMPKVLDEVLQALDEGWDFSTIGGHRAWCKIDTGSWSAGLSEDGLEMTAEIDLSVKLLTDS